MSAPLADIAALVGSSHRRGDAGRSSDGGTSVALAAVIPMTRLFAILPIFELASPAGVRLRVRTLAFNGHEEVDVFRTHLPPEDFEIVDLSSALATPAPTAGATASWPAALRSAADLRSDVVVFSAESGRRFFGHSGRSPAPETLEGRPAYRSRPAVRAESESNKRDSVNFES